jgi:hypothetical protein
MDAVNRITKGDISYVWPKLSHCTQFNLGSAPISSFLVTAVLHRTKLRC